jgi:hypothetical protein
VSCGAFGFFQRRREIKWFFVSLSLLAALTWSKVLMSLQRKHARVCFTKLVGGSAAVSIADADAILGAERRGKWDPQP